MHLKELFENMNHGQLSLTYDLPFKYILSHTPNMIVQLIKFTTNQNITSFELLNPIQLSKIYQGKNMIFDLFLKDNLRNVYDIEMQKGPLTKEVWARMQHYAYRMTTELIQTGQHYYQGKAHSIIILDDCHPHTLTVNHSQLFFVETIPYDSLVTYHIVYLSAIKDYVEKEGYLNVDTIYKIFYVLIVGFRDDIMELEEKELQRTGKKGDIIIMEEKWNEFMNREIISNEESVWWTEYLKKAQFEREKALENEVQKEKELRKQEVQKEKELRKQEREHAIKAIMKRFNLSFDEASHILFSSQTL